MDNWEKTKVGKEIELKYGKGLPKKKRKKGKYLVFGSNGCIDIHNKFLVEGPGIIIGRKGTVGAIHYSKINFWPIDTTYYVKIRNDDRNNLKFWYYFLQQLGLEKMNTHSAVPGLNRERVYSLKCTIPPLKDQLSIKNILSLIDEKIELKYKMNETLEKIAQAIFKSWFIDFEPFQECKFVETDLGEIPEEWKVTKFGDLINLFDSKRIPLSKREREKRKGPFPYYGATSIMDYIDDYLFDGIYLLIAEDGSVMDDFERPVLQYVHGKFWVNNHAHIIQGKDEVFTEYLYLYLKYVNVKPYVTGAVQPKINQGNLNRIPTLKPTKEILNSFKVIISPFFEKIRINQDEIINLRKLRDLLLPQLITGRIRIENPERFLE